MNKILMLNPNEQYIEKMLESLSNNDGYCPCQIEKTENSKCPYSKNFLPKISTNKVLCKNSVATGRCHCLLYIEKE
jgi:ferredoxin-thioredoxin reductase catalytic subunit